MEIDRKEFDRIYRHTQRIFKKYWYEEYKHFLEESYDYCANVKKLETLLDIGCYTGVFHLFYEKYFSRIELADVADQRATPVIDRFPFHIFSLDASTLPLGIKEYDFINCLEVIEHVADDRKAVTNLFTLLKPDGYILLSVPNKLRMYERVKRSLGFRNKFPTRSADDYINVHYREYSIDEIKNLLKSFGFRIEREQIVLASIGPLYLSFLPFFPEKYKKNVIILAQKPS